MQVAAGVHQPELGLIDLHTKVTVNQEVVTGDIICGKVLFTRLYIYKQWEWQSHFITTQDSME